MENRDTITIERTSLYRIGYLVALFSFFIYFTMLILFGPTQISLPGVTVTQDLVITFTDNKGKPYLTGHSDFLRKENLLIDYCPYQHNNAQSGCLTDPHNQVIKVATEDTGVEGITCYQVRREGNRCVNQVVKDCYDLGDSHWYGGFEAVNQAWPLKKAEPNWEGGAEKPRVESDGVELPMGPYISGDFGIHRTELANVLERLFYSSAGVGIMVSRDSPLYLSFNQNKDGQICLAAVYDGSYYSSQHGLPPVLEYTICKAGDVRQIHDYMRNRFIPKPEGTPNLDIFKNPIWSTWAQFNRNVNQTAVIQFADKIFSHKLPASQLEIDDRWTAHYGDLDFDPEKFPDPQKMVADLNKRSLPVTVWTHPFISLQSESFKEAFLNKYIVMAEGTDIPALTKWWNDDFASLLDVTNPAAVLWYQGKLNNLQKKYNISSFKFDAGEAHFVPHAHQTFQQMISTNQYTTLWAELALSSDPISRRQEVRACWNTQKLPVFVRIMDRMSSWDRQAGLLSIVPSILTLGLIGYPFVLPDMIGGNAYADMVTFKGGAYPERELYIRWLQLNTFLPALQFSVAPWNYDEEVVLLAKKFMKIREQYIQQILDLAEESVKTGNPIIRPIWWNVPLDENALVVSDEFLLGDSLLVAPVVVQGARKRDIYLPEGAWEDKLRGGTLQGPRTLVDYLVSLDELAFFEKVH